ncbi:unnamed protein product [Aphanomyces euteiches]|uniref:FAM50A/XAP5 C-terminal domain-containing protein n=1 Tax=Aphanomyces euteiches TaxID=100861 RepID=A0A6G0XY30_9STRA|nr:hypothetical protein Ae201684_000510 [Aphanomyces euteiches]KAH9091719.1 hypothetical protein Ae201684P_011263 [Aphanomyces euteiches]KAH9141098.1 hypothetical protein AeRB84_014697 [Aphanomyces euteiches]
MSDIRRYGSSGIHTVEGNVAGSLAAQFAREREKQEKEYADKKKQIEQENARASRIDKSFETHKDAESEAEFKRQTVGLVTAEEFRRRREASLLPVELPVEEEKPAKHTKAPPKKKKTKPLSFSMDSDEEEAAVKPLAKKPKLKCPYVETAFLPDKEREEEMEREKRRLTKEWIEEQERIKDEMVAVAYSYWDGMGHRKDLTVPKRTTIRQFLDTVRQTLVKEFPALRGISVDNLMYIKEDLIIPHNLSFYDLIVTQARGKSGPLFHFDVREDVRLVNDVRVEKEESHPGKVTHRGWYEKNKHIFPASRWETYDPAEPRDAPYSLRGND